MTRLAQLTWGLAALFGASLAVAQEKNPTPAVVIYPGDIIRESMLVDVDIRDLVRASGSLVESRAELIGKAARRTLLPGAAIAPTWVESPRAIYNGAQVRVIFREDGLTIVSSAAAMQAGAVGDTIRLRSGDGGATISGVILSDGTVQVGDR